MATQALFDLGNVILEPTSTFARLKEKTHAWLPVLVTIVLSLALMYWWVSTLDFTWLREHMIAARPDAKPDVRAAMEKAITPTLMLWSTGIGAVVTTLLAVALMALYYLIAGKLTGSSLSYGKWFGFAAWTSVPRLLSVPLSAVQIITSRGQLAPEDLNMVSLNYLVFHLPASHPWASWLTSLDLTTVWSIVLAVIGLKVWTGRPTGTCVTVAVLPYVIIYGLWAVKIAVFG